MRVNPGIDGHLVIRHNDNKVQYHTGSEVVLSQSVQSLMSYRKEYPCVC